VPSTVSRAAIRHRKEFGFSAARILPGDQFFMPGIGLWSGKLETDRCMSGYAHLALSHAKLKPPSVLGLSLILVAVASA